MVNSTVEQKDNVYEVIKNMRYPDVGKKMKWNLICKKLGVMQDTKQLDFPVIFSNKTGSWLSVFYARLEKRAKHSVSTDALGKITHILSGENISSQALGKIMMEITKL